MRSWQPWHYRWVILVGLLTLAVAVAFGVAAAWRESSAAANFHSIASLWISVLGFMFTLWTLFDTQRVIGVAGRFAP